MFILSQDKKKFAEYKFVEVSKNYGGKKGNKYCLVGTDYRDLADETSFWDFIPKKKQLLQNWKTSLPL